MNLLASGGLSVAEKATPVAIATLKPIFNPETAPVTVSKWAWLSHSWPWILFAIIIIVAGYFVIRKWVIKK